MSTFKRQINEQLSLVTQSLSSPQRLEMLDYLLQKERSVDELSLLTNLSVANTSRHLQVLKQASLVIARRDGKKRFYRPTGDDIVHLLHQLHKTAQNHLAEIMRLNQIYLQYKDELEPISAKELLERLKYDEILILDIRPQEEFDAGHLPNAINIPPNELLNNINQLDSKKDIVAYCRGAYCLYSHNAVTLLQDNGFHAQRLITGFPKWRADGYPYSNNLIQSI